MDFSKTRDSVAGVFRQLGWLNASLYLLNVGLTRATRGSVRLHKYYFIAQPVAAQPLLSGGRGAAIEVREVAQFDPLVRAFPRPAWVMPYRYGQGAVCLAAFKDASCVGFLWMLLGPYREDEVRCRYIPLPQGAAAWDFDVYVYPEHRNSLVFLRLWDEANRYLAARGVRWSLSRISAFNPGSLSSHARMGARRIGSAVFLSIGSWQISAASVPTRFSISKSRVPSFALNAEQAKA
jgi:hypothetical protein